MNDTRDSLALELAVERLKMARDAATTVEQWHALNIAQFLPEALAFVDRCIATRRVTNRVEHGKDNVVHVRMRD